MLSRSYFFFFFSDSKFKPAVRKGRKPAAAARHRRLGRESAGRGATSALLNLRRSHHVRELVVVVVVDPVWLLRPVAQIRVLQALVSPRLFFLVLAISRGQQKRGSKRCHWVGHVGASPACLPWLWLCSSSHRSSRASPVISPPSLLKELDEVRSPPRSFVRACGIPLLSSLL
jgi:hypothetical protein